MPEVAPMTESDMAEQEASARRQAEVWLDAFLAFPTADNFDGVAMRMREYQTAWMHGRRRPDPAR